MAYFSDTEEAVNTVVMGEVDVDTDESITGPLTKENIGVTSNGKSECYVRMRVEIPTITYTYTTIENGITAAHTNQQAQITLLDGTVIDASAWNGYGAETVLKTEYDGVNWIKKSDGFWYLTKTLKTGESADIIKMITYPGLVINDTISLPDGLTKDMLTVIVTSEAVQADNVAADGLTGADAAKLAFDCVDPQ